LRNLLRATIKIPTYEKGRRSGEDLRLRGKPDK